MPLLPKPAVPRESHCGRRLTVARALDVGTSDVRLAVITQQTRADPELGVRRVRPVAGYREHRVSMHPGCAGAQVRGEGWKEPIRQSDRTDPTGLARSESCAASRRAREQDRAPSRLSLSANSGLQAERSRVGDRAKVENDFVKIQIAKKHRPRTQRWRSGYTKWTEKSSRGDKKKHQI